MEETENGSNWTMSILRNERFHTTSRRVSRNELLVVKVHATTSERHVGSFNFLTSDYRKIVHSGKAVCKLITRKQSVGSTAKV